MKLLPLALSSSFVGHREFPEVHPYFANQVRKLGGWGVELGTFNVDRKLFSGQGTHRPLETSAARSLNLSNQTPRAPGITK